MTKKELKDIAHAIVWNAIEGKKLYQFPKDFFYTAKQNEVDLLADCINKESTKLQELLKKQFEAEDKRWEAERYAYNYNIFPMGKA